MKLFRSTDNAFTGLEAAIVLIAFVVVAAVFSYVVLGAGFFTTQKSQETVHTSVGQASSSLEIIGNVIGVNATADNAPNLQYINVTVGLTAGGTAMDLDTMVVSYNDGSTRVAAYTKNDGATVDALGRTEWTIAQKINANANDLLESGEQFVLSIGVAETATPNTKFTVNLQPSVGAVTAITRTVPAALHQVNILY